MQISMFLGKKERRIREKGGNEIYEMQGYT